MKNYTVKKVTGTPDWNKIPAADMDVVYRAADVKAWAQVCWDENGFYVHLQAVEANIRSELNGLLDEVCCDSCLEFFIRPTEALSYFNIEFNPNCAVYLGYATSRYDLVRLLPLDYKAILQPVSNRTPDGWEITYRVPFDFIQKFLPSFDPKEGYQFYGNFYKCGDHTVQPHYFSWNPIEPGVLDFHCPKFFGRMILGGEEI